MDWAAHLEHLQTVFWKFDTNAVISELVLICLFYNSLTPSICTQAKQESCSKDIWDQAIRKAIMAEAKAALNLLFWVREIDTCCFQGHCSASKPIKNNIRDQGFLLFRPHKAQAMPSHCSKRTKTKRPCQDH